MHGVLILNPISCLIFTMDIILLILQMKKLIPE